MMFLSEFDVLGVGHREAAKHHPVAPETNTGQRVRRPGIAPGDVILTVNGQDLDARTSLGKAIWRIPVGDAIEFQVDRLGERMTLATTLQGRPTPLY